MHWILCLRHVASGFGLVLNMLALEEQNENGP